MQTQKDQIKQNIIDAAIEEFILDGYDRASMRSIAKQAGITVGNIYSYFSGKEALFDTIITPTMDQLDRLIGIEMPSKQGNDTDIAYLTEAVMRVFCDNRTQFLILMNGSDGSKYENVKSMLVKHAAKRFMSEPSFRAMPVNHDLLLADSIAAALIEGMLNIFMKYGEDEVRLRRLIRDLLLILIGNIINNA